MTPQEAIAAHIEWKNQIHALLSGAHLEKLDPRVIGRDYVCELGQWLHLSGRDEIPKPQYAELLATHAQFHREAARIVEEFYAGSEIGIEAVDTKSHFGNLTMRIAVALLKMVRG